jgi:2-haloacid dehalogenase
VNRYRWLLLDLDGTLLDYDAAASAALLATLATFGIEGDAQVEDRYQAINAELWAQLERGRVTPAQLRVRRWESFLPTLGLDAALAAGASRTYLERLAAGGQVLAGVHDALERLAATHRMAVITNGFADVQRSRLAAAGLAERAEVIVISDEVGAAKPDRRIFDAAFASMGDPARDEVLIVGDSPSSDVAGGAAYGIDTCLVDPTGRLACDPEPTMRVAGVRELAERLAS